LCPQKKKKIRIVILLERMNGNGKMETVFLELFNNREAQTKEENVNPKIKLYKVCLESNETDSLGPSRRVREQSLRADGWLGDVR
jgi:hypothetical protein